MRKIGIFGGSFDPIHFGHLRPALEILDALSLDSMHFIPSGQPPHRGAPAASAGTRLAMLKAAVAGEPRFQVDEREIKRATPSYTFDTLKALRQEHGHDRLVLVLGLDAFLGFTGWHRWKEILDLAHLVVTHRPGWSLQTSGELAMLLQERQVDDAPAMMQHAAGKLMLQTVTQLEISSSQIRETAARGGDLRFLVPDPVRALIQDSHCYA
ncbi:MAG TPA: nicotinate-nucleotide adenylyltransferase [Gammaproteobacteria bacterium]|jgi:nicotinate-nucleotide adenylyltransferase|nr:nicotinate-nucleotide adenylyltransferase [Gammaproteobacteria bacterium]